MIKKKLAALKRTFKNELSRSKEKVRKIVSKENAELFGKGFLTSIFFIGGLSMARPVLAKNIPNNITKGNDTGCEYVNKKLGPEILRDSRQHALNLPKHNRNIGPTKASLAAAMINIATNNSAFYLGITSGIIVTFVVFTIQKKYLPNLWCLRLPSKNDYN